MLTEKRQKKVKINGYVDEELWRKFLRRIFDQYGKTSGGAISSAIEEAIATYLQTHQSRP